MVKLTRQEYETYERVRNELRNDKRLMEAFADLCSPEGRNVDIPFFNRLNLNGRDHCIYFIQGEQKDIYKFIVYFYETHYVDGVNRFLPEIVQGETFVDERFEHVEDPVIDKASGYGRLPIIYLPRNTTVLDNPKCINAILSYAMTRIRDLHVVMIASEVNIPSFTNNPDIIHIKLFHNNKIVVEQEAAEIENKEDSENITEILKKPKPVKPICTEREGQ